MICLLALILLAAAPPQIGEQQIIKNIVFSSKVKQSDKDWEYTYSIKNNNKTETFLVTWETIDRSMGFSSGPNTIDHVWELKPGKEVVVKVLNKSEPVKHGGLGSVYTTREGIVEEWYRINNITVRGGNKKHFLLVAGNVTGFIPEQFKPRR